MPFDNELDAKALVSGAKCLTCIPREMRDAVNTLLLANIIPDPLFAAAHGFIQTTPARTFLVLGRRAGFNSTTVLQDVGEFLGTTTDAFPELTGTEALEVVSSSAQDAPNGLGTWTVKIAYLDRNFAIQTSPDITLNGVTAVPVPFRATFIYYMEATSGGANTVSVGNILLRIAGGGATQEQITAGGNKSLSCRFMVPANTHAHAPCWSLTAIGNATQDVRLRGTVNTRERTLNTRYIFQDNAFVQNTASSGNLILPWLTFPPLCRIKVSTIASNGAVQNRLDASFTLLLMQN